MGLRLEIFELSAEFVSFKPSNKSVSRRTVFPAFLRIWFVAGTGNSLGAL